MVANCLLTPLQCVRTVPMCHRLQAPFLVVESPRLGLRERLYAFLAPMTKRPDCSDRLVCRGLTRLFESEHHDAGSLRLCVNDTVSHMKAPACHEGSQARRVTETRPAYAAHRLSRGSRLNLPRADVLRGAVSALADANNPHALTSGLRLATVGTRRLWIVTEQDHQLQAIAAGWAPACTSCPFIVHGLLDRPDASEC